MLSNACVGKEVDRVGGMDRMSTMDLWRLERPVETTRLHRNRHGGTKSRLRTFERVKYISGELIGLHKSISSVIVSSKLGIYHNRNIEGTLDTLL